MANADKSGTCARQQATSQGRSAGEISPSASGGKTVCVDSSLNKSLAQSTSIVESDNPEHNHQHSDLQTHSRKHKRKQREPRRISNPVMPQIVKEEIVKEEPVDVLEEQIHAKSLQMARAAAGSRFEFTDSDDETDFITNRNKFRPITPQEGREVDPFQFHSPDNEDEEGDIGLHESMSGGSHGSPTSEDGDHGIRTNRGSKKSQRSYKNLSRSRRIVANARERNRVHTISAAFEGLRRAVPSYSHNQKLSKLAILRIACSYILALAKLADKDYTPDQTEELSFGECVDMCTKTLQSEGRSKRRKVPLD
ncbi:uncharacterized protein [Amphiura filiformis]|uniref:uncharacterized protein n=1 Tax=Amphiura filiformis TaxID=82378 RepID=UPI003B212CDF